MKPFKPLYLKTYGRQKRKLSAWISPDDRKQAFESTESSDGSVFEPPRQRRPSKRKNVVHSAKEKAIGCQTKQSSVGEMMSDEENIPPSSLRETRRKKIGFSVRVRKRRTQHRTKAHHDDDDDDDDATEDFEGLSTSPAQLKGQSNATRKASASKVREEETVPSKRQQNSVQETQTGKTDPPPSVGRFVTRRRRTTTAKPRVAKAAASLLSSSDDFTVRESSYKKIQRPSRRRRLPPLFPVSSAENSLNAAGTSGQANNLLREISLNELTDPCLGSYARKPIFCSTPSAGSISNRGHLKQFLNNDQSSSPPSISLSYISDLSTFQGNGLSPTHIKKKLQNKCDEPQPGDPSADMFLEHVGGCCSEDPKNSAESASVQLLSSDNEGNSQFVSAAGGFEWLTDALKRKCLTNDCKVRLERLNYNLVTRFCSQTSYSSCFEHSNSIHNLRAEEQEKVCSASDSLQSLSPDESPLSESNDHTRSQEVNGFDLKGQDGNIFPIDDIQNSNQLSNTRAPAKNNLCQYENSKKCENLRTETGKESKDKTRLKEDGGKDVSSSSSSSSSLVSGRLFPEEDEQAAQLVTRLKEECVKRRFSVQMKRESLLTLKPVQQLKDSTLKSPADVPTSRGDVTKACCDTRNCNEDVSSTEANVKSQGSPSDDLKHAVKNIPQRKMSLAAKEKKRRGVSTDRPGTARKACVSGMSTSRWKTKDGSNKHMIRGRAAPMGEGKSVNCSINDLIPRRHSQTRDFMETNVNFSTPLRTNRLGLSSLLADLTPSTPTWSRLKAALSVHRKVMLTPRFLAPGSPGNISQDLFGTTIRTPVCKSLLHRSLSRTSLDVCEGADLSEAAKVCAECGQQQPLPWEACIPPERMKRCVKIGEGTFGEVFSTTNSSGDTVALKIIPVEGSKTVNGEDQKTFGEILHEIIISKELSSLKEKQHNRTCGFIGLNDLHCVQGCYPPDFLKAWDTFDQHKGSENDRPDFFGEDQFFIILEFEFGGVDLENSNGTLASFGVAKSILHQVTASLAVAEQELHFEHRDLHWGNVLVKSTKQRKGSFLLNGAEHCLELKGVLVRIIDYSLSRLEIDELTVSCDISNDEELFLGQGDYQFEIYRLMRKENGNNWSSYHPHTNVLWLHYLCSKLLSMKYRSSGGKGVKEMRKELTRFYDNVLHYGSATEVLQSCPLFQ